MKIIIIIKLIYIIFEDIIFRFKIFNKYIFNKKFIFISVY